MSKQALSNMKQVDSLSNSEQGSNDHDSGRSTPQKRAPPLGR